MPLQGRFARLYGHLTQHNMTQHIIEHGSEEDVFRFVRLFIHRLKLHVTTIIIINFSSAKLLHVRLHFFRNPHTG